MIDNDACVQVLGRSIPCKTEAYLERKRASLYGLSFNIPDGSLSVPDFKKETGAPSYKDVEKARIKIIKSCLFFFLEIYVFGNHALSQCSDLAEALRMRFPLVLIDEMQDTQKF